MQCDHLACEQLVELLWDDPDQLIEIGRPLTQKQCVRTTVAIQTLSDQYVVKRHLERSWRHIVKQWFCISRAEKCWRDTLFLVDNGYPTPKPIGFQEQRLGSLRGKSYFVYEYVEGETLRSIAAPMKNQRLLRQYVRQLCEIWRLHWQLEVNLHDGHPDNFLVAPSGKIWVIDLDKLQRLNGLPDLVKRNTLIESFLKTITGVFGDFRVINYGERKIMEMFQASPHSNAAA